MNDVIIRQRHLLQAQAQAQSATAPATALYLDREEVLPMPGGDVCQVSEPQFVSQRHREVEAASVEAGAHVRGGVHGHALRHGGLHVADGVMVDAAGPDQTRPVKNESENENKNKNEMHERDNHGAVVPRELRGHANGVTGQAEIDA